MNFMLLMTAMVGTTNPNSFLLHSGPGGPAFWKVQDPTAWSSGYHMEENCQVQLLSFQRHSSLCML